MTGEERFNRWFKKTAGAYEIDESAMKFGFSAGYAQGCSDAKAMRGRCKQCAQVIEEGSGVRGSIRRVHEDLRYQKQKFSDQEQMLKLVRKGRDRARQRLGLAEDALRVYRENPRLEEAKPRVWQVVMPNTPGVDKDGVMTMEIFQGAPLEALEHFVKLAYEAGKRVGR